MSKLIHSNRLDSSKYQEDGNSQETEQIEQTHEDCSNFDQDFLDMSDLVCDEDNYQIPKNIQKTSGYLENVSCYTLHLMYVNIYCYEPDIADLIMSLVVFQFNFKNNHKLLKKAVCIYCHNRMKAVDIYGHIAYWNVSRISNFSGLFMGQKLFNDNINNWNMSNAKTTKNMFKGAISFNQPLDKWDMSNVEDMSSMFHDAFNFNQSINKWNVSKCKTLRDMFQNARKFNQPLNDWDTSNITHLDQTFMYACNFNQDISSWDVSKVYSMLYTFAHAYKFNCDLSKWKFNRIHIIRGIFARANSFKYATEFYNMLSNYCPEYRLGNGIGFIGHNYRIDRGPVGILKDKVNSEIRRTVPLIIY